MAKSPEELAATMIANLKEKTGKTLEQWIAISEKLKAEKHGQIVKSLKAEHSLTHGFANLIAHKTLQSDAGSQADAGVDLVEQQYAGPKAELRPIYAALIKAAQSLGTDVEVAAKKSYVSLRRSKQFALIQPSTKTRLDLGLNLKGAESTERLETSGSFNSMVSHRVRLSDKSEVDRELKAWLKAAYTQA